MSSLNGKHLCVLCDQNFQSKQQLQEHFREHGTQSFTSTTLFKPASDSMATFKCELCGQQTINVRTYWQHYQRFHPEWRGLDCPYCGKHFIHTSDFSRHREEAHSTDSDELIMPCPRCDSKFHNEAAMNCHMQVHTQVQQMETLLQEQSNQQGEMKRMKTHSTFTLRASYCKLCQCQFATSTALAQHLVVHSLFLCLTCGQELSTDEAFRSHQSVHLPTSADVLTVKVLPEVNLALGMSANSAAGLNKQLIVDGNVESCDKIERHFEGQKPIPAQLIIQLIGLVHPCRFADRNYSMDVTISTRNQPKSVQECNKFQGFSG